MIAKKIYNLLSIFKPTPKNISEQKRREIKRQKGIYYTALASLLAKIVSMFSIFITIPITLSYLGNEKFGIWMTLGSIVAMLSFADMGIGNGIINRLTPAIVEKNSNLEKKIITNAIVLLLIIAIIINLIFHIINQFVDWSNILNIKNSKNIGEIKNSLYVFVFCFSLNIIFSIIQKIQLAYQRGFISSISQLIGSILSLIVLFIFINAELSMPWLIIAISGIPALVQGLNLFIFYLFIEKKNVISIQEIKLNEIWYLLRNGYLFFILQLSMAFTYTSDNIVINSILGADAVAIYSVHNRLFSIIPVLLGMVLIPLWPAYTEARIRNDIQWIKMAYKKTILLSIVVSLSIGIFLLSFLSLIFKYWLENNILPMLSLAISLMIWKIIESLGLTISSFMNGMNIIKIQAAIAIVTATITIILKFILVKKIGIIGVVISTAFPFIFLTLIPMAIISIFFLKRKNDEIIN